MFLHVFHLIVRMPAPWNAEIIPLGKNYLFNVGVHTAAGSGNVNVFSSGPDGVMTD